MALNEPCACNAFELMCVQAGNNYSTWKEVKEKVEAIREAGRAETVPEGPEPGEVCVAGGHRPVVRDESGVCFMCADQFLEDAEEASGAEHGPWCSDSCECLDDGYDTPRGLREDPKPIISSMVTYVIEGGMHGAIIVPQSMEVSVEGGTLSLRHNLPITGIVSVAPIEVNQ